MKPRLLIVGGGISGLVTNWVWRDVAHVTMFEPGVLGGEFPTGGLKYIHRTDPVEALFGDLGIAYSSYVVRGGILLRGQLYLHPQALQAMKPEEAQRIRFDHYRKTRRSGPGDLADTAMNDPAATGPRRALRCDLEELVSSLGKLGCDSFVPKAVGKIDARRNMLFDADRKPYSFDFLVLTIPLWIIRHVSDFFVPESAALRLNVARVSTSEGRYASFDYIYTPYTPADTIHRFSPKSAGYSVEANGVLDLPKLQSDLAFIFPEGYHLEAVKVGLNGHLLPLREPVDWPRNVAPVGRFAKWDSRSTMDVALADALALKERWL